MISPSRRLLAFTVAVSMVGTASACGGNSSPAAAGSSGPASTAVSASAPPAGGNVQRFCEVVKEQKTLLQGTELSALLTGGGAAAWKTYLDRTSAMNQQLVDAAPADIQASVKTLQEATSDLKTMLAAADYDPAKVGTAKLIQILQTPQRKDANAAVVAYVKTQCDIDLTKVG